MARGATRAWSVLGQAAVRCNQRHFIHLEVATPWSRSVSPPHAEIRREVQADGTLVTPTDQDIDAAWEAYERGEAEAPASSTMSRLPSASLGVVRGFLLGRPLPYGRVPNPLLTGEGVRGGSCPFDPASPSAFTAQSKPDGVRLTSMRPPARVAGCELESHWPARPAQAGRRPRPRSRLASRLSAPAQGHRAEGHAASAEGRHVIAAGLAVVVAVRLGRVRQAKSGRTDFGGRGTGRGLGGRA